MHGVAKRQKQLKSRSMYMPVDPYNSNLCCLGVNCIVLLNFSSCFQGKLFQVEAVSLYLYNYHVLSCSSPVQLLGILWTIASQAFLTVGFSRQEYWSGLPCPPPGDLPDRCLLYLLHWQAGSLLRTATWEALRAQ